MQKAKKKFASAKCLPRMQLQIIVGVHILKFFDTSFTRKFIFLKVFFFFSFDTIIIVDFKVYFRFFYRFIVFFLMSDGLAYKSHVQL